MKVQKKSDSSMHLMRPVVLTRTKLRPDYAIDGHEDVRCDNSSKPTQDTGAILRMLLCICCAGMLTYKVYGLPRRSG